MAETARVAEMHVLDDLAPSSRKRTLGKLIPWPFPPKPNASDFEVRGGTPARAEIRTKRFVDHWHVDEERYQAEVVAADSSIQSVMQALADAFSGIEEFVAPRSDGEAIVMEIRLRA